MKIGIIGYGFVGKTVAEGLERFGNEIKVLDPYKEIPEKYRALDYSDILECPIIFIALPTVPYENGNGMNMEPFDITFDKLKGSKSLIIIKSTVLPGTTREYSKKYELENLCFMPEFLSERTALIDFLCPDRIILGTVGRLDPRVFLNLFSEFKCPKIVVDAETAELTKFASNCFFATKVTFANEFYDIANYYGVNWEDIKKLLYMDYRIGEDHLSVFQNKRGYGGHCLGKDSYQLWFNLKDNVDVSFLKSVIEKNKKIRNKKEWEP